nr:hypothetical protein [Tanacetum cinerariifolium]
YASPAPHQDLSPFNQNYMQQPMANPKDITDPTIAMNMELSLMAKALKRISSNPRNKQIAQPGMNMGQDRQMQMVGGNGGNQFRQYAGQNAENLNGYNAVQNVGNQNQIGNGNLVAVRAEGNAAGQNGNQIRCYNCRGIGHYARNYTARPRRRDAAYLQTQLLITQKEEAGIQLQAEAYDLMAAAADIDEIEEVNANCILMANLQQASSSGTQTDSAPSNTFDELMSTPIEFSVYIMNGLKITNLTQETLLGPAFRLLKGTRTNYVELEYDFEECYKDLSEKLDWENPKGGDYLFDLTKTIPLVMSGNRQKVHIDYFFNNDLKYLQGGVLTMTYTTSITKTKAAQYDLPGIKDMGLESRHDVYSTKSILAVTRVEIMRKHGYEYLKEIKVRRSDIDLYTFKEGDFPRLRINDIEDMLLLVVQNRLINILVDDVSDFTIPLRMFTRSLVIQKRVEDL